MKSYILRHKPALAVVGDMLTLRAGTSWVTMRDDGSRVRLHGEALAELLEHLSVWHGRQYEDVCGQVAGMAFELTVETGRIHLALGAVCGWVDVWGLLDLHAWLALLHGAAVEPYDDLGQVNVWGVDGGIDVEVVQADGWHHEVHLDRSRSCELLRCCLALASGRSAGEQVLEADPYPLVLGQTDGQAALIIRTPPQPVVVRLSRLSLITLAGLVAGYLETGEPVPDGAARVFGGPAPVRLL